MRAFIRRARRQIAADRVVRVGRRIRRAEAIQHLEGADYQDYIDSLCRERDRLLDYIRNTAPQEA